MKRELSFKVTVTGRTPAHTHTELGVQPFNPNEGLMIDWAWLLQLVIVIVKPLTVSLYNHRKIILGQVGSGAGCDKNEGE